MTMFVRVLGAILGAIIAVQLATVRGPSGGLFDSSPSGTALFAAWVAAWLAVGFLILPYLTIVPAGWLVQRIQQLPTGEFVTAVAGLLIGLMMGLLLGLPLSKLPYQYGTLLPIGTSAVMGLGMLGLTVAKRHDLRMALEGSGMLSGRADHAAPEPRTISHAPASGSLPLATGRTPTPGPDIVIDSSVFIDGRLPDVVASGFVIGTLVVPRFVLEEMQRIADSSDTARRNRGRRGLEVVAGLQKESQNPVEVTEQDFPDLRDVDAKLVALARARGGAIMTTDFNLNRVASVQGVRVLNLHHLANAVKQSFLPGERMRVKVVQPGKEPGQGVAYLADGTMIVVEGGGSHLERELEVTVTRVLQTVAGKMVFAHPKAGNGSRAGDAPA
ncbi:TRAM domain-containing protein [soil metagenome]